MRLIVEDGDRRRLVDVEADPTSTVAQLAAALDLVGDEVLIDGVPVHPGTLLDATDIVAGTEIASMASTPTGRPAADDSDTAIVVTSGPGAGERVAIGPSRPVRIGRASDGRNDLVLDNPTVSIEHAEATCVRDGMVVRDLGSKNGLVRHGSHSDEIVLSAEAADDFGAPIHLGSSTIEARRLRADDRPTGAHPRFRSSAGTILVNRPPRRLPPAPAEPIRRPPPLEERANPTLSLAAMIAPIVFAGVMVLLLGRWQYAVFALLSPVMVFANWLSARRRVRRERDGDVESRQAALDRVEQELIDRRNREARRLHHLGPDLDEIHRRARLPSHRLWERRSHHEDAWTLRIGHRRSALVAEFVDANGRATDDTLDPECQALVDALEPVDVPVLVNLDDGPVGIVAPPAVARSACAAVMLQLVVTHGPADAAVTVVTSEDALDEWAWVAMLPHSSTGDGGVRVLTGAAANAWATTRLGASGDSAGPRDVVIVEDLSLLHERGSALRGLYEQPGARATGILLSTERDQLPASVGSIVDIDDDGAAQRDPLDANRESMVFVADLPTRSHRERVAQAVARWQDPDVDAGDVSLPSSVDAAELFGDDVFDAESIGRRWQLRDRRSLVAPLGFGSGGAVEVDLVSDGPHGLVAGTTGAGKSELLRTWVLSIAANHSPEDVVFVLVDYKGGAAFDCCADLPHVVGMVTDLDGHLAARALVSLEAELHHRELVLRDAGVSDSSDLPLDVRLPRLVVVIDEFATLRAELPDFMSALVGIAQRGRSLGVHLILATQRPSGAVDANVRANTNLRIALRVQDQGDSKDVIDDPAAAEIARHRPGRCWVRRGASDLVAIQTAYVSGGRSTGASMVRVGPVLLGSGVAAPMESPVERSGDTELQLIVDAIRAAAESQASPRRPWLPELPDALSLADLCADNNHQADNNDGDVVLGLADHPNEQAQRPWTWPSLDGHLLVVGALGSGVSTTLWTAASQLATRGDWVYVADEGGALSAFGDRVAGLVSAGDVARHRRLLTVLAHELDERQGLRVDEARARPSIRLIIDGVGSFMDTAQTESGGELGDAFARLVRDGPGVGMTMVVGAASAAELPRPLRGGARHTVVHELTDRSDLGAFGLRPKDVPTLPPGRAVHAPSGVLLQVARSTLPNVEPPIDAPAVDLLPTVVRLEDLPPASVDPDLRVPVGILELDRTPATLLARTGEAVLISGPAGSGRTSTLRTIARSARAAASELVMVGVGPDAERELADIGLDAVGTHEDLHAVLEVAASDERRWLILVDDADRLEDAADLADLASSRHPAVTVVAAGLTPALRQSYGHWARRLGGSGVGVLLHPEPADGELLGVRLPRSLEVDRVPGRAFLAIPGEVAGVVHVAT